MCVCECVNSQKVVALEGGGAEGRELGLLMGIELVSGIRIFQKLGLCPPAVECSPFRPKAMDVLQRTVAAGPKVLARHW